MGEEFGEFRSDVPEELPENSGNDENEVSAKAAFSRIGWILAIGSVLFIGIQYGAILLYRRVVPADKIDMNAMIIVELIPTYLFTMPLIIYLLGTLPGILPQKRKMTVMQFFGAMASCFGIMITCNLAGILLTGIIGRILGRGVENQVEILLSDLNPLVALLAVSVAAPVMEELVFRKMLISRVLPYGEGIAILLSGLMFGLFHGNLNQFGYTVGLGLFLGFVYIRTGKIGITIALHSIINFSSSVLGAYVIKEFYTPQLQHLIANRQSSELMVYLAENMGKFLMFFAYLAVEYGLALAGVIVVIVWLCLGRFRLVPGKLGRGKAGRLAFGNAGMILFCVFWIGMIITQLFGIR
ncbi:MAG: CPBP family intramembrane metalloprotease [Lachnospiraceae bacterium]|nr:CPBP family intramembrane metalloprotease [Lachnospiraceae bacterium]